MVKRQIIEYDDLSLGEWISMDEEAATQWVRGTIRSHMGKAGYSYASLTRALRDMFELEGDEWNEKNVANKVARGHFSAVFFMQCLEAMGVKELKLDLAEQAVKSRRGGRPEPIDVGAEARERAQERRKRKGV